MADTAIQPKSHFLDEKRFKSLDSDQLHLGMELGKDYVSLVLIEKETLQYIGFEKYLFFENQGFGAIIPEFEIILEHSFLRPKMVKDVNLSINNSFSTIIPNPIFNQDKVEEYIGLNFEIPEVCKNFYENMNNVKAKNVFAFPKVIFSFIKNHFSQISFHHHSTFLIESLMLKFKGDSKTSVVINTGKENFQLLIFENHLLKFYNSFNYLNEEDFIYFILFTIEQLKINIAKSQFTFLGILNEKSPAVINLSKYIGKINSTKYQPRIPETTAFDKSLYLENFSIFNQHLCV